MRTRCCNAPLVEVTSVSLDFVIGAASPVPIMASSHINSVLHHTCSSVSNTFRKGTKHADSKIVYTLQQLNIENVFTDQLGDRQHVRHESGLYF